ncbi:MAG: TlpA disulfide reductase family protein, partial [Gemmatimonadota bacterium]
MNATLRSGTTALSSLVLAALVLVLGLRNRALEERNRGLVRRFTEPHPGMLVPSFSALTLRGDTAVVGAPKADARQVVWFFTTTCPYCRASLDRLRSLDSALRGTGSRSAELLMVGLDSADAVRRYADSLRLSVPILLLSSQRLTLLCRVRAVPQLMVLDSSGRALYTRAGALVNQVSLDSVLAAVRYRPPSVASGPR